MRTKTKKLSIAEMLAALESGKVLDLGPSVKMPVVLTAAELARVAGGMMAEPTTSSGSVGADDCGCW